MSASNFPLKDEHGKEWWISRSIVCSSYIFAKCDGFWYVLVARRGEGSTSPGQWNVPGGFLDFGERLDEAAAREAYEETGIKVRPIDLKLFNIDDKPRKHSMQHVTMSFYTTMHVNKLPLINLDHNELNEVETARWVPIDVLYDYNVVLGDSENWLRGHLANIKWLYENRINPKFITIIKNIFSSDSEIYVDLFKPKA